MAIQIQGSHFLVGHLDLRPIMTAIQPPSTRRPVSVFVPRTSASNTGYDRNGFPAQLSLIPLNNRRSTGLYFDAPLG